MKNNAVKDKLEFNISINGNNLKEMQKPINDLEKLDKLIKNERDEKKKKEMKKERKQLQEKFDEIINKIGEENLSLRKFRFENEDN